MTKFGFCGENSVDLYESIEYNYLTLKDKFGYNDMISDSQVNELFILLGKIIHRNFRRREAGVTVGEGALLACLIDKGSLTVGELCEIAGFGSGRIANLLKATEAKGTSCGAATRGRQKGMGDDHGRGPRRRRTPKRGDRFAV